MELAAKILFFAGTWYLIGFLTMYYLRWELNKNVSPASAHYDKITMSEVWVLALLGVITFGVMVTSRVMFWWYERKIKRNRE